MGLRFPTGWGKPVGSLSISSPEPPLLLSSTKGILVAVQKDHGLWERDWLFISVVEDYREQIQLAL